MCIMHAVTLAILGLAATGAVAGTPNSWSALVQEFPTCAQKCMDDYYQEAYSDKCGSNSANADLKCICTATDSAGNVSNESSDLSACIEDSCSDLDASDASQISSASNDILSMCSPYYGGMFSSICLQCLF